MSWIIGGVAGFIGGLFAALLIVSWCTASNKADLHSDNTVLRLALIRLTRAVEDTPIADEHGTIAAGLRGAYKALGCQADDPEIPF